MNRTVLRLAGLLLAVASAPAAAYFELHGFGTQAYLLSDGNDYYGNSSKGSFDFYEAALNAATGVGALHASAQVLIRDAGNGDDGKPRLDYALIDWQALHSERYIGGLRLGRVKNPFGLFNDTRDFAFARPSILLPQSVYFDGAGLRGLFFSSDGGQLYGSYSAGAHELSLVASAAIDRQLDKEEKAAFIGKGPLPDDIGLRNLRFLQLSDRWDGGRVIAALSHLNARLELDPQPPYPVVFHGNFDLYVASLRLNGERFSITSEYLLTTIDGYASNSGNINTESDGAYLQFDYRLTPAWRAFVRWDSRFADIHDRDGRQTASGGRRYLRFAHDATVGGGWTPDEHWGVWAEVHQIYGTLTVPALDNSVPSAERDPRWTLFALMLGYRF